jgi:hypothetical protein
VLPKMAQLSSVIPKTNIGDLAAGQSHSRPTKVWRWVPESWVSLMWIN